MIGLKRIGLALTIASVLVLSAQAQDLPFTNSDFESGDFTNWTVTGDAWSVTDATDVGAGKQGTYFASGYHFGEDKTGTITSQDFVLGADDDRLTFLIGGWDGQPGVSAPKGVNYVQVKDASTDSVIGGPVAPPNGNGLVQQSIDLTAHEGKTVYVEVVDGDDAGAYAWIIADNFRLSTIEVFAPAGINGNGNFETGDYTGWTATGTGFGAGPVETNGSTNNKEGFFFADTLTAGETATGTLTSDVFTVTDEALHFMIAGHDGWPGDTAPKGVNYVQVKLAADNSVIGGPVAAPNSNNFVDAYIDLSAYQGQDVYVEIADGDDAAGFAWICADNFRLDALPEPMNPDYFDTYALRAATPPTINGTVDPAEYGNYGFTMTNAEISVHGVRTGGETTDADISGTWYFAWDDTNLYVAAIVQDDVVVYNTDEPDPMNNTDGIQFVTNHANLTDGAVGTDDGFYILDLVPGQESDNNTAGLHQHWPTGDPAPFSNVVYSGSTVADGYHVEMAIPWSDFRLNPPSFTFGDSMGFASILMDTEDAAAPTLTGATPNWPWVLPLADWPVMTFIHSLDDYDGDGLTNAEEEALGTDPWDPDTDNDGLSDYDEVHVYGTDPLLADTDGDGVSDGEEVAAGSDPLDPDDYPGFPAAGAVGLGILCGAIALSALRRRSN